MQSKGKVQGDLVEDHQGDITRVDTYIFIYMVVYSARGATTTVLGRREIPKRQVRDHCKHGGREEKVGGERDREKEKEM